MPEEKKRDKVEGFINELAATVNVCAMYGEKHKLTVGAIDKLHESLNAILSETEETTIGVIGDEVAFEEKPFYETSTRIKGFIDHLREIGVGKISFFTGVSKEELKELVRLLNVKPATLKEKDAFKQLFEASGIENMTIGKIGYAASAKGRPPTQAERDVAIKDNYDECMDYLTKSYKGLKGKKPLNVSSARQLVGGMITDLLKNKNLLVMLASARSHDDNMLAHGVNVSVFTLLQAEALGLDRKHMREIGVAALLHDTGKLSTSSEKSEEKDELTEKEEKAKFMQDVNGAKILLDTPGISTLAAIVTYEHNIPYDNTGEPRKLYGEELNLASMMIAVSEHYDKLRRKPDYQKDGGAEKIYEDMMKLSGKKFQPDLLNNFFTLVGVYPPGTLVELDSGDIGLVIQASKLDMRRPQVEILYNNKGERYKETRIINLLEKDKKRKFKWTVVRSVSPAGKYSVEQGEGTV
ncbi:MAG: HD domain-containing protein [Candidatus Omnitrophica bacterium]|nr:HD domain-containing protein [Candidatus Omnitrophota bacterium]